MKKNSLKLFLLFLLIPALFSCNKDKETEGISRKTEFPVFEMQGDEFQSIVVGGTYTDAGVTATEGGADIPVTVTGNVDTSTPGVYTLTFTATNKDGFSGTTTRTIAVLPQAEQSGVDISGSYSNVGGNANTAGLVNTVTKLAPGFYHASNVWGGTSGAVIAAYIITTDGVTLDLPLSNISPYGRVSGSGTLSPTGLMELSVTLLDQGPITRAKAWQRM